MREKTPLSGGNGSNVEHISKANFAAARLSFLNSTLAKAKDEGDERESKKSNDGENNNNGEAKREKEEDGTLKEEGKEGEPDTNSASVTTSFGVTNVVTRTSSVTNRAIERESKSVAPSPSVSNCSGVTSSSGVITSFGVTNISDVSSKEGVISSSNGNEAKIKAPIVNGKAVTNGATFSAVNKVKLTRRTSTNSLMTSSTILKGTPKPIVVVKSKQTAPSPPPPALPPKEKPKIPAKPKFILSKKPTAAPRRPSFKGEYANVSAGLAECYNTEADTQNEVIFEVNATRLKETNDEDAVDSYESDVNKDKTRNALDDIRRSLEQSSNSISFSSEEQESSEESLNSASIMSCSSSSSFAETRATVASALIGFNRHDQVARPSTKKKHAPLPPPATIAVELDQEKQQILVEQPIATASTLPSSSSSSSSSPMPPSALRTVKNENGAKPNRVVQFSPDTKTTSQQPTTAPVPYNKWIVNAGVIESSFTGQPIKVAAQAAGTPVTAATTSAIKRQPRVVAPAAAPPMPPIDDEMRKWTEKKKRSKSVPRGSELDELMGSSKAKPRSNIMAMLPASLQERRSSSPPPIRRQSRVELYENDRKKLREKEKGPNNVAVFGSSIARMINRFSSAGRHGGSTPTLNSVSSVESPKRFMDEEHEREIVEREKLSRDDIIQIVNNGCPKSMSLRNGMLANVKLDFWEVE
jgi:hypothetical protein